MHIHVFFLLQFVTGSGVHWLDYSLSLYLSLSRPQTYSQDKKKMKKIVIFFFKNWGGECCKNLTVPDPNVHFLWSTSFESHLQLLFQSLFSWIPIHILSLLIFLFPLLTKQITCILSTNVYDISKKKRHNTTNLITCITCTSVLNKIGVTSPFHLNVFSQ